MVYIQKMMPDFKEYHMDLYHAKLKWMSFQSGYIQTLWSDAIQNQISALSNLAAGHYDLEAHLIACQTYFGERASIEIILQQISICLKGQESKDSFTLCLFNRLNIMLQQ